MSEKHDFLAIVLAAGQGTRMKSDKAKVLHELVGRPMVSFPIRAALNAGASRVIAVVGRQREKVEEHLRERFDGRVLTALQAEQRGTGHAAQCGYESAGEYRGWLVILYGDCPLITAECLQALVAKTVAAKGPLVMVVSSLPDASGYGRILRDASGAVVGVREHKDCTQQQLAIKEFNPGLYAIRGDFFARAISKLSDANAQGEVYLTDLVTLAAEAGGVTDLPWPADELMGINDRFELAECERALRLRIARKHALNGVTIRDPLSAFIDADVTIEPDAVIESSVTLRGRSVIGSGARIDVGCVLTDVTVAAGAQLLPYTVATDSGIGERARVGPFSHLRPASQLGPEVHLGNFVETKKTQMDRGSKANHLAYLGDGVIGKDVNVGAGTIFCNYDGVGKYTTVLEDGCFIGSDSQIVAPLTVGKGSYVATGTTLTRDVPADALAIGRAEQENKEGFAPRLRKRFEAKKRAHQKSKPG